MSPGGRAGVRVGASRGPTGRAVSGSWVPGACGVSAVAYCLAMATSLTSDDVRTAALALPQTTEKIAWSMPTFRVAGKMFATLPEDETSIAVRCPKEERDELVLAEPRKFWIADHEAMFAWVRARIDRLEDMDELRDILADSWRQAAPTKLLEQYPELGLPPRT